MTLTKSELLGRAAERTRRDDFFIGKALAEYMAIHSLDMMKMARKLSCSETQLSKLALCRLPKQSSGTFRTEIEAISTYAGIDPLQLGQLIREVESTRAFEFAGSMTQHTTGYLLAARDKFDESQRKPKVKRKSGHAKKSKRRKR